MIGTAGCASGAGAPQDTTEIADQTSGVEGCQESENLLADVEFTQIDGRVWQYTQHSGERSFSVSAENGELIISRVGVEPWMLFNQTVEGLSPSGAMLRLSAELKGQVEYEVPLHGFEHVAGLFLQSGRNMGAAKLAEHEPNQGVWEWQRVTIEASVIPGATSASAGFVHQGGGTLWARNPRLVLVTCDQPD